MSFFKKITDPLESLGAKLVEGRSAPEETEEEPVSPPEDIAITPESNPEEELDNLKQQLIENLANAEEARLNERFGEGKIACLRKKLETSESGKALKIAGKVLGGLAMVGASTVLPGFAGLLVSPRISTGGMKLAADGAVEAVQYYGFGGRKQRLNLEVQKKEILKTVEESIKDIKDQAASLSPEEIAERMMGLVSLVADEEEKILTAENANIARENKLGKIRSGISTTATIGLGLLSGVSFGEQDFDKDGVAHEVRASMHGFDFLFNSAEEIAQHKTDMHGLLSGDVARNLYGKIGESLQERMFNGGAMGIGSVMAAAALFKKTKAELSQKPGEVSTKMEQPVIGFEGLVTEEEPVSSDSDPAPSAEPSFSEEPVLEVESSSSPEEVRVEGGEEPAAIPEVEESHIDSSAAVPPASSAPTPEGFIPETSGIETGSDTGDSVSIPDDSPKPSPSRPGGDPEVGPHGELLLTPLESLQRDPFPSTDTEWNEELGGRTKRVAVSINKPEVKDWLLGEAVTIEGVKKILLLPPATPLGDVQDAYEAFAASLRKTGRHYKDNKSSLEEVLGKIKATIKGSIPKISDPDPEPEPSGPAGGSAAKEMELPETELFPRRSSAREVHRAAGVGKPPMPVGSKVEPAPAEAGTAAEPIPAAADPIKDDSESVSTEGATSAAESEVSSDPESEAIPSKEKNLEEEPVHELWEDRVETVESTRYKLITRRTEHLFENLLTEEGAKRADRYLSRDGLRKLFALPKDVPAETLRRGLDNVLITLEAHPEYLDSEKARIYTVELKHIVEEAEREERKEDERIEAEKRALMESGEGKTRRKDSRSRRKDYDGHAEKWR